MPSPGKYRNVAVIGAGYVGLPTAATLAHFGHKVVLAEREPVRLAALQSGKMPIVEAGLDELVAGSVQSGNLRFCASAVEAVGGADFVFLCVPTPQSLDGSADLSYVEAASKEIGGAPQGGGPSSSTSRPSPVGSATMVEQVIGRPDIKVVSNPEFLREGTAVSDSLNPDRIVVGSDDAHAATMVGELFSTTGAPLIVTDATTSETIKYASNAFLATKLSFVNALAGLCEEVGADARDGLAGPWLRQADRFRVPATRTRLGWFMPAQGHPRPGAHRPTGRATTSHSWRVPSRPTTPSRTGWWPRSSLRQAVRSKTSPLACGASPSRPTPTTDGTRPASKSATAS